MDELRDCLNGRPQAWHKFVQRYLPVIHAAVRRVLRDRVPDDPEERAKDVVQDVFVKLVKDDFALLGTFDPARATLVTWLTIIARSTAWDDLRKRREPAGIDPTAVPDPVAPPDADASDSATAAPPTLELPPGLLSARQLLVMQLLYDRQMDVPQVAKLLGIEEQSVRSAKHKALEKLRLHYKTGAE